MRTPPPGSTSAVRRSVLPGGLRVVTETMPGVRSVTLGVWVGVGSRDETASLAGASHFLEHLLFKGTRRRSALDIAAEMDAVGGELNAFTGKESTCFYAHVIDRDLPLAVDLIGDVLTNAVIASADVDGERNVILEEIAMRDDDPGDLVHDLFGETLLGDHPLGRPVIGSVESIESLRRSQIAGFYRRRYTPSVMVVSAAGNLDHDELVTLVEKAFDGLADRDGEPAAVRRGGKAPRRPAQRCTVFERPSEQAHLSLGCLGLDRFDDRRYALGVLNNALGGGMSSRLFQEVREKRGLVYTVYSYAGHHAETGTFNVYAGCQPGNARQVLGVIREVLDDVAQGGLSDAEVSRGIGQFRGGLLLGLEDTGSRMTRIGKSELSYGEQLGLEDLLQRIEAVTVEQVRSVARDLLQRPMCLAVVGPFPDGSFDGDL